MSDRYEIYMQEAEHYRYLKQYERALKVLDKALSERPNDGRAFYCRALCLHDNKEALQALHEALRCNYNPQKVHYTLGAIYMDLLDFGRSEQHLLEALRLDPQDVWALSQYAMLMYKTGWIEKSDMLMAEAAAIDPMNPKLLEYRLDIEQAKGTQKTKQGALSDYTQKVEDEFNKLFTLGFYYKGENQNGKAYECFRQAFLLRPNSKTVASMLEELESYRSWIYFPTRIFWLGNTAVIWLLLWIVICAVAIILEEVFQVGHTLDIIARMLWGLIVYWILAAILYVLMYPKE